MYVSGECICMGCFIQLEAVFWFKLLCLVGSCQVTSWNVMSIFMLWCYIPLWIYCIWKMCALHLDKYYNESDKIIQQNWCQQDPWILHFHSEKRELCYLIWKKKSHNFLIYKKINKFRKCLISNKTIYTQNTDQIT